MYIMVYNINILDHLLLITTCSRLGRRTMKGLIKAKKQKDFKSIVVIHGRVVSMEVCQYQLDWR